MALLVFARMQSGRQRASAIQMRTMSVGYLSPHAIRIPLFPGDILVACRLVYPSPARHGLREIRSCLALLWKGSPFSGATPTKLPCVLRDKPTASVAT